MREVHKKRLLKLAALLEKDAKNKKGIKFDLGKWGVGSVEKDSEKLRLNCNTTACIAGLAALSGQFKGLGYELNPSHWNERNEIGRATITIRFKDETEMDAAGKYFGVSPPEKLFAPWYYPPKYRTGAAGERYAAKRIRYLVKYGRFPTDVVHQSLD